MCCFLGSSVWGMGILFLIHISTVLWKKMSLTCWLYTLHSPVEGSRDGRNRQIWFHICNDNGGENCFWQTSSQESMYVDPREDCFREYARFRFNCFIVKKNIWQISHATLSVLTFDDSGVPMFSICGGLLSLNSVKSTQMNMATSLSFYNIFSTWKCSKKNWTNALVLHVFHDITKSTFFLMPLEW